MFALKGSIPYYAPRDGSWYVLHALGKVNYGEIKYIKTSNPQYDSNLYGYPNNDVADFTEEYEFRSKTLIELSNRLPLKRIKFIMDSYMVEK